MNTTPKLSEQTTIARLSPGEYAALERKLGTNTVVNQTTTELQAAYQLGIQHTLKILREGWPL